MSTLIELESACHRLIAENAKLKLENADLKRTVASFELAMKRLVEKYAGAKVEAAP